MTDAQTEQYIIVVMGALFALIAYDAGSDLLRIGVRLLTRALIGPGASENQDRIAYGDGYDEGWDAALRECPGHSVQCLQTSWMPDESATAIFDHTKHA